MFRKIQKYAAVLACAVFALNLTACGEQVAPPEFDEVELVAGEESSRLGVDSEAKNFMDTLVSGSFYVVHNGVYYPVKTSTVSDPMANEKIADVSRPDPKRQMYYTLDEMVDVPTFYPGDHLVFYSTDEFLDVVRWERFYDMGPSISVMGLKQSDSGRYYINTDDDENHALVDSDMYDIYNLGASKILIDKVGGVVVDDTVMQDGVIIGATAGKTYDVEVYTGTIYKHYSAVASMEAFKSYEIYASTVYETLQDCFWEIEVPEYMLNGYYNVNDGGLIRVCRDAYYDENTDFNEQLLYPDRNGAPEDEYIAPRVYSENELLNEFKTTEPENADKFGYIDPDAEPEAKDETEEDNDRIAEIAKLKEANIVEYDIWFPAGKQCTLTIVSPTEESTGGARVTFENGTYADLSYNRFDKVYEAVIAGKDNVGHLVISGFWHAYDINMTNAQIYNGQDQVVEETQIQGEPTDETASTEEDSNDLLGASEEAESSNVVGGIIDGIMDKLPIGNK